VSSSYFLKIKLEVDQTEIRKGEVESDDVMNIHPGKLRRDKNEDEECEYFRQISLVCDYDRDSSPFIL
jgi:hypothetical protein